MATIASALASDDHLNTGGAAATLHCSRQTVLKYAAIGLLAPVPVAGKVFFNRREVEALAQRLAAGEPVPSRARSRA